MAMSESGQKRKSSVDHGMSGVGGAQQIGEVFDLDHTLRHVDAIFDRTLREVQ